MPKGIMRPPSSLPTRSEHMANTYPEAMAGGGGKKPPTNKMTMTGGPSPDGPSPDDKHDFRSMDPPPVTGLLKRKDTFSSGAGSARLNETSDLRLSGYPLGGFSGWFDHAEQQEEKSRRAYAEYTKFNKGK